MSALPQRRRAATLPQLLEQVRIPANATAPPRVAADEFHTIPRPMLQLLAELDSGQLALPTSSAPSSGRPMRRASCSSR